MPEQAIATTTPQTGDTALQLLARLLAETIKLNQIHAYPAPDTFTALASAARTANTVTADIDTTGYRSMLVFVNITSASGTGGVAVYGLAKDHLSGNLLYTVNAQSPNATATGIYGFAWGQGAGSQLRSSPLAGSAGFPLAKIVRLQVLVGDATSYTYSVSYQLFR